MISDVSTGTGFSGVFATATIVSARALGLKS